MSAQIIPFPAAKVAPPPEPIDLWRVWRECGLTIAMIDYTAATTPAEPISIQRRTLAKEG